MSLPTFGEAENGPVFSEHVILCCRVADRRCMPILLNAGQQEAKLFSNVVCLIRFLTDGSSAVVSGAMADA